MKNKKAFTMVEVIGAVVIMGVILMLVIPGVSHLMKIFRQNYYEKQEEALNKAGQDFFLDNPIYKPEGILHSETIDINTLISQKYINDIKDYKGKNCEGSYVVSIYKGNGNYDYYPCLMCNSDNYYSVDSNVKYCDSAWKNNGVHYGFGKSSNIYVYYGTSRDNLRNKLFKGLEVYKLNDQGIELDRVSINSDTNGILPNNIDEIDTKPILDSNNQKIIPLEYKISNNTIDALELVIYKHKAPNVSILNQDNSAYIENTLSKSVTITLSPSDDYLSMSNTKASKYQWYVNDKWEDINCEIKDNTCTFELNENIDKNNTYKFKFITNEENISDETKNYIIKIGEEKKTYIIKYCVDANCKNSGEANIPNTICIVGEKCALKENTFKMASYHYDNKGWHKSAIGNIDSNEKAKETYYITNENEYKKGNITYVTDLGSADEIVRLYSVYKCDGARAENITQIPYNKDAKEWPWTLVDLDDNGQLVRHHSNYGCSGVSTSRQTCIYSKAYTLGVWEAYHGACKYCGTVLPWYYCPIHYNGSSEIGGGGAGVDICDVTTKTYSSLGACNIADPNNGWTKVNKFKISFVLNGGTLGSIGKYANPNYKWVNSTKTISIPTYGKLPTPTKNGYTFKGWSPDENGARIISEGRKILKVGDSYKLYAVWVPN